MRTETAVRMPLDFRTCPPICFICRQHEGVLHRPLQQRVRDYTSNIHVQRCSYMICQCTSLRICKAVPPECSTLEIAYFSLIFSVGCAMKNLRSTLMRTTLSVSLQFMSHSAQVRRSPPTRHKSTIFDERRRPPFFLPHWIGSAYAIGNTRKLYLPDIVLHRLKAVKRFL